MATLVQKFILDKVHLFVFMEVSAIRASKWMGGRTQELRENGQNRGERGTDGDRTPLNCSCSLWWKASVRNSRILLGKFLTTPSLKDWKIPLSPTCTHASGQYINISIIFIMWEHSNQPFLTQGEDAGQEKGFSLHFFPSDLISHNGFTVNIPTLNTLCTN